LCCQYLVTTLCFREPRRAAPARQATETQVVSDGSAVVLELKPGWGAMPSEVIVSEPLDGVPAGSTKVGTAFCAAQKTIKAATPKAATGVDPAALPAVPKTPVFVVNFSS